MPQHTSADLFKMLHVRLEEDAQRTKKIQERLKGLWAEAGFPATPEPNGVRKDHLSPAGRARQVAAMKAYWAKRRKAKKHG